MVKIVDGLEVKSAGKWYRFGKIIIHYDNLDDLKLNCKYATGSQIPKLRKTTISEEMAALLMSALDTQEINFELAKQLTDQEKDLLVQLMKTSGLSKQLNFTRSKIEPSRSDLKLRYNVLIGQIEAGNNSTVIVQELKQVIEKLIKLNVIEQSQGNDMIDELKDI